MQKRKQHFLLPKQHRTPVVVECLCTAPVQVHHTSALALPNGAKHVQKNTAIFATFGCVAAWFASNRVGMTAKKVKNKPTETQCSAKKIEPCSKKNFVGFGKSSIFATSNNEKKTSQEESNFDTLRDADVTQLVE